MTAPAAAGADVRDMLVAVGRLLLSRYPNIDVNELRGVVTKILGLINLPCHLGRPPVSSLRTTTTKWETCGDNKTRGEVETQRAGFHHSGSHGDANPI